MVAVLLLAIAVQAFVIASAWYYGRFGADGWGDIRDTLGVGLFMGVVWGLLFAGFHAIGGWLGWFHDDLSWGGLALSSGGFGLAIGTMHLVAMGSRKRPTAALELSEMSGEESRWESEEKAPLHVAPTLDKAISRARLWKLKLLMAGEWKPDDDEPYYTLMRVLEKRAVPGAVAPGNAVLTRPQSWRESLSGWLREERPTTEDLPPLEEATIERLHSWLSRLVLRPPLLCDVRDRAAHSVLLQELEDLRAQGRDKG